ncbi:MAG: phosphoenolpyruvate--protein phosphotransferase [Lachnospiraceae bacterium]|nr:phosphoenolpyruvate--protein phosphotransferase [Lachnospiraceae bacterium]
MKTYHGKGVYGAIAFGTIAIYTRESLDVSSHAAKEIHAEFARLEDAMSLALRQLKTMKERALQETDPSLAQIFEAHEMLLSDQEFQSLIRQKIMDQSLDAEHAVSEAADEISNMFVSMGDPLLSERATDIEDVAQRLIRCLASISDRAGEAEDTEGNGSFADTAPGTNDADHGTVDATLGGTDLIPCARDLTPSGTDLILCARDLTPSDTMKLDKNKILAFVTAQGSLTSHVAILAKGRRIPAVVGVGEEFLKEIKDGDSMIVDGFTGTVYVNPDSATRLAMLRKQEEIRDAAEGLQSLKGKESVTMDGTKIEICANIGSVEEATDALKCDADGIGLMRSEFLFLEGAEAPSEETQFKSYRAVLELMGDRKVIIRTLDIGADKQPEYMLPEHEENPALGLRAIRLCLTRPSLFKTQLRALYRASVYGNLGILFPMITSVSEVEEILKLCEEARSDLDKEGIPYNEMTELGLMIETPAAALISDRLAPLVDFFSIGTNDLAQYTLALDRQNARLETFADPHHEAVLRLIKMTAESAKTHDIGVGICGELASDPSLTETFLRMGIDELSVSPSFVLPLRRAIRSIRL